MNIFRTGDSQLEQMHLYPWTEMQCFDPRAQSELLLNLGLL